MKDKDYFDNNDLNKTMADAEMQIRLLEIRREMRRKKEKKRETFDMIFPEFKNIPIVWIVIGLICVFISLFSLIL